MYTKYTFETKRPATNNATNLEFVAFPSSRAFAICAEHQRHDTMGTDNGQKADAAKTKPNGMPDMSDTKGGAGILVSLLHVSTFPSVLSTRRSVNVLPAG